MSTSNGPLTDEDLLRAQQRQNAGIPNMLAGIPQVIPPQLTKPTNAQSHAEGIAEFNRGIPQVTAQPGTPEFYQQKMSGIEYQKAHPFGSDISAHPGVGGKILHGLATIGNIAGDVIDPEATALIPGSNLNRAVNEKGLADELNKSQQEATQKEAVEQRPDIAEEQGELKQKLEGQKEQEAQRKQQSDQDFKTDAAKEHEDFLTGLANKKTAATPFEQWAANPEVYDAYLKAQAAGKQQGKGSMMSPYAAVKLMDYAYLYDPRLLPFAQQTMKSLAGQLGMPLPEGMDISTPPAGQPRTETGEALGLRQPEAPTSSTRGRGQFSESAITSQAPGLKKEINDVRNELGPVAGRWNEFMTGEVGADNPKLYGLRTGLQNFATAWMRLHANSDQARQEFEQALSRSRTADDLIAAIDAIDKQATSYVKQGKGNQPTGENAPPAGAKIISLPDFLKTK